MMSVKYDTCTLDMNPRDITSSAEFYLIVNKLPFANKLDIKQLYVQYKHLIKFVIGKLESAVENDELPTTTHLLKLFMNEDKECCGLGRLLSFSVCFPVSEAIVESWGSTISHFYSIKHNPSEPNDDLTETGTVDKLTFIRLSCGPTPGMYSTKPTRVRRYIFTEASKPKNGHFQSSFRAIQIGFRVVFMALYEQARNVLHDRGLIFEIRPKNDQNRAF